MGPSRRRVATPTVILALSLAARSINNINPQN
jgi:hypothetical protein